MAHKAKPARAKEAADIRDRKRDREGWKASRQAARRNKGKRRAFEQGEKF